MTYRSLSQRVNLILTELPQKTTTTRMPEMFSKLQASEFISQGKMRRTEGQLCRRNHEYLKQSGTLAGDFRQFALWFPQGQILGELWLQEQWSELADRRITTHWACI